MSRSWQTGILVLILSITLMVPGFVVLRQLPSPLALAPMSVMTSMRHIRSVYPRAQILTLVPDSYDHHNAYRYRVRTPNGHLWHVYVDTMTDQILAQKPIGPGASKVRTPPKSGKAYPLRNHAEKLALRAVGGGQVVMVRSTTEDRGQIFSIELMLTDGHYAKIRVNPTTSRILSIQVEQTDH